MSNRNSWQQPLPGSPGGSRPTHRSSPSLSSLSLSASTINLSSPVLSNSPFGSPVAGREREKSFGMERGLSNGANGAVGWGGGMEYEEIQNRTFCKWLNSKMMEADDGEEEFEPLTDLGNDFRDGVKLIRLIDALTGEKMGKYTRHPSMRVQKAENVSRALEQIKRMGVVLTNIGPEDIVDGNRKLILGMVWSVVLRFSIADISEDGSKAKDGLLLWCQRMTRGYEEVEVQNFTRSWQDGLAFCALIEAHRPDLIDYSSLDKSPEAAAKNTELAFKIAEETLGIARLLDVEDVCGVRKPDERSLMTYVASFFHAFSSKAQQETATKVIHQFAQHMASVVSGIHDYERLAREFLDKISSQLASWTPLEPSFPILRTAQLELDDYKKTLRLSLRQDRGAVESLLKHLQIKLGTYGLRGYEAPRELGEEAILDKWDELVEAEKIRSEMIARGINAIKLEHLRTTASLANGLYAKISDLAVYFSEISLTLPLDVQQGHLHTLLSHLPALRVSLSELRQCESDGVEMGLDVGGNEGTVWDSVDLENELSATESVVESMISFLSNQMTLRKIEEILPEQKEEYVSAFSSFATEGNSLSSDELGAALSSLGISDVPMERFSTLEEGGTVGFEEFMDFLVERQQDTRSTGKVLGAFTDIGQNKGYITELDLKRLQLPAASFEFLRDSMPQVEVELEGGEVEGGFNYEEFVAGLL